MLSYQIKNQDDILKLVNACRELNCEVDILYQKQVIDGKSVLGVASLMGHIVTVNANTDNKKELYKLEKALSWKEF